MTTITVTQEMIDRGVRHECARCPVALALQDAGFEHASVGMTTACLSPSRTESVRLPQDVLQFICDFDFGRPVSPFTFEIEVTP